MVLNNVGILGSEDHNLIREVTGFNSNNQNNNGCFSIPHGSSGIEAS